VLINQELSLSASLLTSLYVIYLVITLCISYYCSACWVPTISVLNLAIFPCYSNLLLIRRRWIEILWWGVLGVVLPQLPFLWCYGVFCCSVLLESHHSPYRHYLCNNYILFVTFGYLWTLLIRKCGTIDPWSYIWWILGFSIKTGYDIGRPLFPAKLPPPLWYSVRTVVRHIYRLSIIVSADVS
jgi:hypothetical protein